jgi:glycosyltransferase involved in cell wall biosynthesis
MDKKKVLILSGFDISQTNGVNYVTNMFLKGRNILNYRGYEIHKICHPDGIIDCTTIDSLPQFDKNMQNTQDIKLGIIKKYIVKISKYHLLLVEIIQFYIRHYLPAAKTVKCLSRLDVNLYSFIIFQDFITAYIYHKYYKNKNIKTILILHTGEDYLSFCKLSKPLIYKYRLTRSVYTYLMRYAIKNVNKLVVLSEAAYNSFDWVPNIQKHIIYNGIERFDPLPTIRHDTINFVCVANLIRRKGQDLLIESLHLLSNEERNKIRLYLVGEGQDRVYYESLVNKYKLSNFVFFTGNSDNVPSLLAKMDVFILASYAEGLPISIIEALRQGLFILASDVGGCRDMIEKGAGEIINLTPLDIAATIRRIVNVGISADTTMLSTKKFESSFSLNSMMNSYADVFEEI